jgi:4,5:9,10-diseco-3-hydroxy-5,9,17-trioxoandrosta-1(10),2-diene-4-oate hydrolase
MEDRWCDVGGVRTRYWSEGPGEGAPHEPLVLLHPHAAFLEHWSPNFRSLAETRRCIALDMIGCGRTDKPNAPYTLEHMTDFLRDFLDALGIARADLLGHSLGGAIALRFALRAPERVNRLVLVASAGLGPRIHPLLAAMNVPLLGELMAIPTRMGLRRFFQICMQDASIVTDEQLDLAVEIHRLPGAQRAALRVVRGHTFTTRGLRPEVLDAVANRLGDIRAPTFIVWGRNDRIADVRYGEAAAKRIAGARLHIFESCGHLPTLERASEFNSLVNEFLGATPVTQA